MFEKEIKFHPAYDKRDENPSKNYGIHGVEMRWLLKGTDGTVQFVVFTNWHLPHVMEEQDQRITNKIPDKVDLKVTYHPMPADVGYHSLKPMYEGQQPMPQKCEYLNNQPCYYDGSGLHAQKVFEILVEKGSDAVWKYLEKYYNETFNNETNR